MNIDKELVDSEVISLTNINKSPKKFFYKGNIQEKALVLTMVFLIICLSSGIGVSYTFKLQEQIVIVLQAYHAIPVNIDTQDFNEVELATYYKLQKDKETAFANNDTIRLVAIRDELNVLEKTVAARIQTTFDNNQRYNDLRFKLEDMKLLDVASPEDQAQLDAKRSAIILMIEQKTKLSTIETAIVEFTVFVQELNKTIEGGDITSNTDYSSDYQYKPSTTPHTEAPPTPTEKPVEREPDPSSNTEENADILG